MIKNRPKNGIEFEAGFGIGIFEIFGRFLTDFGPILGPFWADFGKKIGLGSVPDPQVDSKGRFDPTWERSGSILGPFKTNSWTILVKNLIKFLMKTILVRIYLHTSVVPISLTCVRANALRSRGRPMTNFATNCTALRWAGNENTGGPNAKR